MKIKHSRWFLAGLLGAGLFFDNAPLFGGKDDAINNSNNIQRLSLESSTSEEGCTIEKFQIVSACMGRNIKAAVVLPPGYQQHPDQQYPILYTFHGMGAPYDTYSAMPPLRHALKDKPMIVTCMDGDYGGWYLDSPYLQHAQKNDEAKVKSLFTTFFFDEFIPCMDQNYRVNPKQRMLSGFSMGGFGAFHYMLAKPDGFVSVSSLSGALSRRTPESNMAKWLAPLLGPPEEFPDRYHAIDINERIQKLLAQRVKLPPVYICCGTEDSHALPNNREMRDFLKKQGIPCEYVESGGGHNWQYWKGVAADVIDFHWRTLQKEYSPK